jgi:hypothetical protein
MCGWCRGRAFPILGCIDSEGKIAALRSGKIPNSFLPTKVALINEIADLAEKVGANVQRSRGGLGWTTGLVENPVRWAGVRRFPAFQRTRWR